MTVAALTVALALGTAACDGDPSAGPEVGADVEDVQVDEFGDDPEAFIGEEVTVSGEVSEIVGPNSLRVGGGDFGGDSLLVVSADALEFEEGDVVQVTGEVTADFVVTDVEDDLGLDLVDEDFEAFLSENYIVATEVTTLDGEDALEE